MRPPDEVAAGIKRELDLAEEAIAEGNVAKARGHISAASRLKASKPDLQRLRRAAKSRQTQLAKERRLGGWIAFAGATVAYIILAIRTPHAWGALPWILLAFIAVPMLCAFYVGRNLSSEIAARTRFLTGFWPVAAAMLIYSVAGLAITRLGISSGNDPGQLLLIGLTVPTVYAVAAGSVSGAICAALFGRRRSS